MFRLAASARPRSPGGSRNRGPQLPIGPMDWACSTFYSVALISYVFRKLGALAVPGEAGPVGALALRRTCGAPSRLVRFFFFLALRRRSFFNSSAAAAGAEHEAKLGDEINGAARKAGALLGRDKTSVPPKACVRGKREALSCTANGYSLILRMMLATRFGPFPLCPPPPSSYAGVERNESLLLRWPDHDRPESGEQLFVLSHVHQRLNRAPRAAPFHIQENLCVTISLISLPCLVTFGTV
jgi:hypothetical protein